MNISHKKGMTNINIKNFVLSYYKNAADGLHIQRVEKVGEAKNPHTHDYFQIYYIVKGSLIHYMEDASSELSRGDMFIVPPGCLHYIREAPNTVFYSFSFMPDSFGEADSLNRFTLKFLSSLQEGSKILRPKITVPSEDILFTENIMEHIYREFTAQNVGCGEVIRSYAVVLITMFARIYFESMPDKLTAHFENSRQTVLHCIQYIEANCSENITLDEMARYSAVSKSSLCKLFPEITGCTFNQYLHKCRIEKACEYIKQGYKITAIYGLCGYNDFSTFYRNFKRIMGVSPQKYKEA